MVAKNDANKYASYLCAAYSSEGFKFDDVSKGILEILNIEVGKVKYKDTKYCRKCKLNKEENGLPCHRLCKTCWIGHVSEHLSSEKLEDPITSPNEECKETLNSEQIKLYKKVFTIEARFLEETKQGQGEPRPKKSRILKSRNKVLLVAFLDNKGIVHHEYLPAGQTGSDSKKMPEKWPNGDWILHHNNARPHTAHLLTKILPQPPYSPGIAPNDFFLFPKLKAVLKGRHFDTRDDIIEKSLLALKSIPKELYKNCFDNLGKRWRWCVEARGDYFKKF
ncbi:hypothetical protein LAZ67_8003658 [Cordylochernes scorpioides]|uniref:Transposase n=1 Tax=Cordylochernes scorpioides TaxID=51811 RepID=A0ABY6KSF3_9ARAC|nr:hypothetical protein LAZ67_8003658 [Cordylochernes scorpioides]